MGTATDRWTLAATALSGLGTGKKSGELTRVMGKEPEQRKERQKRGPQSVHSPRVSEETWRGRRK